MKRGKSTGKTGSGNQKTGTSTGAGKKGGTEADEDEESEDEEQDESDDEENDEGDGKDSKSGKNNGKESNDQEDDEEDDDSELDFDSLPKAAQKLIKNLRKENATRRAKAKQHENNYNALSARVKGLVDGEEEESAEERMDRLEVGNSSLAFENATLRVAIQHGIADEDALEYFQFQVGKAVNSLDEGEELDDEAIDEIAERVKKKFGGGSARTSVDSKNNGKSSKSSDKMTAEKLAALNVLEKQEFRKKNPELYDSLWEEVKKKGLLFKRR